MPYSSNYNFKFLNESGSISISGFTRYTRKYTPPGNRT